MGNVDGAGQGTESNLEQHWVNRVGVLSTELVHLSDVSDLRRWVAHAGARSDAERALSDALASLGALRFSALRDGEALSERGRPHAESTERTPSPGGSSDCSSSPSPAAASSPSPAAASSPSPGAASSPSPAAASSPSPAPPPNSEPAAAPDTPARPSSKSSPFQTIVVPRPKSKPAALDADALARLQAKMSGGLQEPETTWDNRSMKSYADQAAIIEATLKACGPVPRRLETKPTIHDEVGVLARAFSRCRADWFKLDDEQHLAVLSYFTARCLLAQEYAANKSVSAAVGKAGALIHSTSAHVSEARCGFVHGLMRSHRPRHGHWSQDAAKWEKKLRAELPNAVKVSQPNPDELLRALTEEVRDGMLGRAFAERLTAVLADGVRADDTRLVNLAASYAEALDPVEHKAVLRAIASAEPDVDDGEPEAAPALPDDWKGFARVEGRTAMLIGGDPRAERIPRLLEMFRFASVEWVPSESRGTRRLDAVVAKMESGTVDVVIVLRAHSKHTITERIFAARKSAPDCFVVLADNFGETQIRLGIERFA